MIPIESHRELDIVVPAAPKDLAKLAHCITGIVSNCRDRIGRIFVVCSQTSAQQLRKQDDWCKKWLQIVHEESFPFSKTQIARLMNSLVTGKTLYDNAAWYYQQLLKMYAFRVIPDLSEDILILDSDFVFRKRVTFFGEDPQTTILLAHGYPFDWNRDSTDRHRDIHRNSSLIGFAKRLHPEWHVVDMYTGIQHHCMFNRNIVASLLSEVETIHNEDFWKAYIKNLDLSKWNAASEYSIYYHYALGKFGHLFKTRHLDSLDFILDASMNFDIDAVLRQIHTKPNVDAVGLHSLVQMEDRFDPSNLAMVGDTSTHLNKPGYVYCIHLNNGVVKVTPASTQL